MTKNRALKRAARQRATQTGESYVVARRNVVNGEPAGTLTLGPIMGTLHRWTHLVPGVPAHSAAAAVSSVRAKNRRHGARPAASHPARPHPARQKRVLRGRQEWIEQRVSR